MFSALASFGDVGSELASDLDDGEPEDLVTSTFSSREESFNLLISATPLIPTGSADMLTSDWFLLAGLTDG